MAPLERDPRRMPAYLLSFYKVGKPRRQSFWVSQREIGITWHVPQFLCKILFLFTKKHQQKHRWGIHQQISTFAVTQQHGQ